MVGQTGIRRVTRGVVVLGAVMVLGAAAPGATVRGWRPVECDGGGGARVGAAATSATTTPWFRLDPRLDAAGALTGQRLSTGLHGTAGSRTLTLPAESFATGPFGGLVLLGADDGGSSRLSTLDVARGCTSAVAVAPDVIRGATIDPTGRTIYEVRVDRSTRADLGVWRRPLDGSLAARRVLAPLRPDGRFGKTWASTFTWSLDGDRLAVQTCGEVACRTRLFDPSTGHVDLVDEPDLGLLVGLTRDRIVTHAACRGTPCPLLARTVGTAERTMLAQDGGPAILIRLGPDVRVVDTVWDGAAHRLRATSLDGTRREDLGTVPPGEDLVTDPTTTGIGDPPPPGFVRLAPLDRSDAVPAGGPTLAQRLVVHPPVSVDEGASR
jgi:hypothetical protein